MTADQKQLIERYCGI